MTLRVFRFEQETFVQAAVEAANDHPGADSFFFVVLEGACGSL
jgi:hypothetical protein